MIPECRLESVPVRYAEDKLLFLQEYVWNESTRTGKWTTIYAGTPDEVDRKLDRMQPYPRPCGWAKFMSYQEANGKVTVRFYKVVVPWTNQLPTLGELSLSLRYRIQERRFVTVFRPRNRRTLLWFLDALRRQHLHVKQRLYPGDEIASRYRKSNKRILEEFDEAKRMATLT